MSGQDRESFRGMSPKDVLISYVLFTFGGITNKTYEERVQVRFLFDIFAQQYINPDQFQRIASNFDSDIQQAAHKLISACISPIRQPTGIACCPWSSNETVVLLTETFLHSSGCRLVRPPLDYLLPERSEESRRRRITRVIQELHENKVLRDDRIANLRYEYIVHVWIPPVDRRSLQQGKLTRGMRLVTEINQLRVNANMERARLCQQIQRATAISGQSVQMNEEREIPDPLDAQTEDCQKLRKILFDECAKNSTVPLGGRRYSAITYNLCELLRATSRKSYRILRAILPLPSETSLYEKYCEYLSETKHGLLDTQLETDHLLNLLTSEELAGSPVTIGINAFSFSTFGESVLGESGRSSEQYSNAFLFLHIPLDSTKQPKPICLQKKSNGAYDLSISQTFEKIKEVYNKMNIPIWFKATDGDRYLTAEHNDFFAQYVQPFRDDFTLLVDKLHEKLCDNVTMSIPDPLHFAKNIRGKIIDHNIALVDHDDLILLVNVDMLIKVLDLGEVLSDRSQLGRMRDVYVTKLFTLQNVCRLIEVGQYASALLFLPYSCIFTLLYSTNLRCETRIFLAKLAYQCFNRLLYEAENLVKNNSPQIAYRFSSGVMAITLAEPNFIKRMMHSALSFGISMLFGPRNLRLDAMGTHLVENSIGVARSTANSTKFENILSAFSTAELRKLIARRYGIQLRVSKRVNDGGAKIDTLSDTGLTHPEDWDPYDIASMFIESCDRSLMSLSRLELDNFLIPLKTFVADLDISELRDTTELANALIVQRNYKFKSEQVSDQ